MKDIAYDRVEYILYNYTRINEIIEEIKQDIIDSTNVSSNAWLKGKISDSNTVENQAIKIADNPKINKLRKAQKIIGYYLNIIKIKNPKRYRFIKLKYFEKANPIEICKNLGYTEKQQIDITNKVVSFFYKQLKKVGGV